MALKVAGREKELVGRGYLIFLACDFSFENNLHETIFCLKEEDPETWASVLHYPPSAVVAYA